MITIETTEKMASIIKDNNTVENRKILYSSFLRTLPGTKERAMVLNQMKFIVKAPTIIVLPKIG